MRWFSYFLYSTLAPYSLSAIFYNLTLIIDVAVLKDNIPILFALNP